MAISVTLVRVLIASPGDAAAERDLIEQTIHEWNGSRAANSGVVLLPVRWESNAVPVMDLDPQAAINGQLVDQADIVVSVFNARLGTVTPRGISGSAEEIERVASVGKPAHVWFSEQPIPRDVDPEQLAALQKYKKELQSRGLTGSYSDLQHLAYQVRAAIEMDVADLLAARKPPELATPAKPDAPNAPQARLRAHWGEAGSGHALSVSNTGTVPAENVSVELLDDRGGNIQLHGPQDVDILDGTDLSWQAWLSLADGRPSTVQLVWKESGVRHALEQSI